MPSVKSSTRRKTDITTDPFSLWKTKILSEQDFFALSDTNHFSEQQLSYLATFGILAPTSHNSVPQRFKLFPDTGAIELWADRKSILPFSDPTGRQATISLGCALKNIELICEDYGLVATTTLHPNAEENLKPYEKDQDQYVLVATITIGKNASDAKHHEQTWAKLMLARRVVRSEYDHSKVLSHTVIQTLHDLITTQYPTLSFSLLTNKLLIHAFGKFQEIADRTVVERETFSEELGHWLLPNSDTTSMVGMRGREFGFDGSFSTRIHQGLLRQEHLLPDEIAGFALGGKVYIKSSPAVGVLCVKEDSLANRIEVGKCYEHMALLLQKHHLVTAIHAAITEVERVARMFGASFQAQGRPTMVFRIGKPLHAKDATRPHSSRPPLTKLLLP